MPNSVHRVKLEVLDSQCVSLTGPPISVGACRDGDFECFDLWFEHVQDVPPRDYNIYVLGTGHPAPWPSVVERSAYRFLGTVIYPRLVWHVYLYIPEVIEAWKQSIAALGTSIENPDGRRELNAQIALPDPAAAADIQKRWESV